MNAWCYKTAAQVVDHAQLLRAEYIRKIQHISVMGLEGSEGIIRWMEFLPSYKPSWYGSDDGAWNVLMQFRALRSLELLHSYFPTKHKEFGMLVDTLPDLERITMVALNCDDHAAYGHGGGKHSCFMHKAELEIPLHSTSRKNTINQLVTRMIDLPSGLKYRLLHAWQERRWVNEPWMSSAPGEWKYDHEHAHATLLLGEKPVRMRLYGQPNSVATRKWIMKEERRAASAEKAIGWPTRAQKIAEQVKVRQSKEESEGEREKEQMLSHDDLLESRAIANREREIRERNDRIKEEDIARNERRAERARQQEEMKNERKRYYRQKNRVVGCKDESLSCENDAQS